MFRIYSEGELRAHLRIKRFQALLLLVAGCGLGLWLSHSEDGVARANPATADGAKSPALSMSTRWCDEARTAGPRFDCTLSLR